LKSLLKINVKEYSFHGNQKTVIPLVASALVLVLLEAGFWLKAIKRSI
jgi:hypothetical protein